MYRGHCKQMWRGMYFWHPDNDCHRHSVDIFMAGAWTHVYDMPTVCYWGYVLLSQGRHEYVCHIKKICICDVPVWIPELFTIPSNMLFFFIPIHVSVILQTCGSHIFHHKWGTKYKVGYLRSLCLIIETTPYVFFLFGRKLWLSKLSVSVELFENLKKMYACYVLWMNAHVVVDGILFWFHSSIF